MQFYLLAINSTKALNIPEMLYLFPASKSHRQTKQDKQKA